MIRKNIGTRLASKNRKNRIRSSDTKLPMQADSSRRTQAMKARGSRRARAPSMVRGNRTAVSTTRNSEMPSTPKCSDTPRSAIQLRSTTNWNPASWRRNSTSR